MSDRHSIRTARLLACALTAIAVAAPAAAARPAQDPPSSGPSRAHEPETAVPARIVPAADGGSEWDSLALGAGGATLVLLLAGTGTMALSRRHDRVGPLYREVRK